VDEESTSQGLSQLERASDVARFDSRPEECAASCSEARLLHTSDCAELLQAPELEQHSSDCHHHTIGLSPTFSQQPDLDLEHEISPLHFINDGCGNIVVTGGNSADSIFTIDVDNRDSLPIDRPQVPTVDLDVESTTSIPWQHALGPLAIMGFADSVISSQIQELEIIARPTKLATLSSSTQDPCNREVTSGIEGIPTVSSESPECWTGSECGSPALTCDGIQYEEVMSLLRRQRYQELGRKPLVLSVTSSSCDGQRRIELSRPRVRAYKRIYSEDLISFIDIDQFGNVVGLDCGSIQGLGGCLSQ